VTSEVIGAGSATFLVDTGAAYSAINQRTLDTLKAGNQAVFVKNLSVVVSDGSHSQVPIYKINGINLDGKCTVRNVEVAVLPGNTRQILGLNALRMTSPFVFSVNPPEFRLSHCVVT
jgi:predicted aspartyl protease